MGLSVEVNFLGYLINEEDTTAVNWFREELKMINRALEHSSLPFHIEPEEYLNLSYRTPITSFPYHFVQHFHRAVAYARNGVTKYYSVPDDANDLIRNEFMDIEVLEKMDSHLICHSDCEGYYVPIEFNEIIFDDNNFPITGGMLCSSQKGLEELILTAPLIGIKLNDNCQPEDHEFVRLKDDDETSEFWRERIVWLTFYEAFKHSIQANTAVVFT